MPSFQYQARNAQGKTIKGQIHAANQAGAMAWMVQNRLVPVNLRELNNSGQSLPPWVRSLQGQGLPTAQEIQNLMGQLAALSRAGIPLNNALLGLSNNQKRKTMRDLLRQVYSSMNRGQEFSAALNEHPDVFSEYIINMVRVGESSGRLHEVFERLHEQMDFNQRMKQKMTAIMRYPMFVLAAMCGAFGVVIGFVVPAFSGIYKSMHLQLPLPTRILVETSGFVKQEWYYLLATLVTLAYLTWRRLQTKEGRRKWDRIKLKLPIVGQTVKKASTARFCHAFSLALRSGVPVIKALELVARVTGNQYYESRILVIRDSVMGGATLLQGFYASELFVPSELQMISTGEQTGDVSAMVSQLATLYQEEVEYETSRLAQIIEPVLLLLMGGLMMILMLGIFLPMWNMTQAFHR